MCTLILFRNVFAFSPLVVAANRDERHDRPATTFGPWPSYGGAVAKVWAPKDLKAGGTWIGVSDRGLFAAVLNWRGGTAPRSPVRPSRGHLPLDALLKYDSARRAAYSLSRIAEGTYDGFSLVVADAEEAYLVRGDAWGARMDQLTGRLHVFTDRGIDDDDCPRTRRIRELYQAYDRRWLPSPESLGPMLSFHGEGRGTDGACVHSADGRHGTRSSTIVRLDDRQRRFELWHREGPACEAVFNHRPLHADILAPS